MKTGIAPADARRALRDALSTLPFAPMSPRSARRWLVDRAIVVSQIAQQLELDDIAAEALQLLDMIDDKNAAPC